MIEESTDSQAAGETRTQAPSGALRITCPMCAVAEGERCMTAAGNHARSVHADRWDSYKNRMRSGSFAVRIIADDGRLGVLAGERYEAHLYPLDPGKFTLVRRIPDGYDPKCNQYAADVVWERWIDEAPYAGAAA